MENLVFTQLSVPEIRQLFRQELETYFATHRQNINSTKEEDKILTIQEAAEFAHLSVPTIYGLVSRAEVPFMKKGKRLYFSKKELIDWIKSGRKKTISEIQSETNKFLSSQNSKKR